MGEAIGQSDHPGSGFVIYRVVQGGVPVADFLLPLSGA